MQFATIFALAAAVVGVSANVHSTCYCVDANDSLDKATTKKSCQYVSILCTLFSQRLIAHCIR